MKVTIPCAASIVFILTAACAFAEVKPNQLFSDHAVLQSGMPLPVWGTADPGEKITVTLGKQKKSVIADTDGKWAVKLGKIAPGGPFVMTITGKNTVTVNDVLVGEDWIGSGQSNMAFTVSAKVARYAGNAGRGQGDSGGELPATAYLYGDDEQDL
jgi:sialate O-acetylesterase